MNSFIIRPVRTTDSSTIFDLILELAEYEKLAHEVLGSAAQLHTHLFGDRPCVEALIAEVDNIPAGFALYFPTYSTFLTAPGIYLEDLYVRPQFRRIGIGKSFFQHLAQIALDRGFERFEWSVLNWNEPAIAFYQRMGSISLSEWTKHRVTGASLVNLARGEQP
ncbi:MAG: GNAT family N-acetyltransferase [Cyanobacteria bacterium J06639_1]